MCIKKLHRETINIIFYVNIHHTIIFPIDWPPESEEPCGQSLENHSSIFMGFQWPVGWLLSYFHDDNCNWIGNTQLVECGNKYVVEQSLF